MIDQEARKEKKPDLSKPIERTEIDKKRTSIFKGFIGVFVNKASLSSLLSKKGKIRKMIATSRSGK